MILVPNWVFVHLVALYMISPLDAIGFSRLHPWTYSTYLATTSNLELFLRHKMSASGLVSA